MSMEDITIYRQLPIINNRVRDRYNSHNYLTSTTAEAAISGSTIDRLSLGSGRPRGWKTGAQEWLTLPGIKPYEWYATDPQDSLNF
jgi:hypothetical protein